MSGGMPKVEMQAAGGFVMPIEIVFDLVRQRDCPDGERRHGGKDGDQG